MTTETLTPCEKWRPFFAALEAKFGPDDPTPCKFGCETWCDCDQEAE